MSRYELGMSLDYPAGWTAVDAIREMFQNALDEEAQNPENKWYFNYDKDTSTLRIGNKSSKLNKKTLLLGVSTKRDDAKTIGQHGEGYKVGVNVLLREGFGVIVYNYAEKEVWHAKVIKSRRYQANIVVFDIEKYIFKSVPEQSLIFEVTGITEDLYKEITEKNLWLQNDLGEVIECGSKGKALLDPKYKGNIYVKGLYVCNRDFLEYGYDLAPELLKLDRDRSLVDSFDLQYALGKLIAESNNADFIDKVKDKQDGVYVRYNVSNTAINTVCDREYARFTSKYGTHAVPCTSTDDFNKLKSHGYNAVMVSSNTDYYISHSSNYKGIKKVEIEDLSTTYDELEEWVSQVSKYIPRELRTKGKELLEKVKMSLSEE